MKVDFEGGGDVVVDMPFPVIVNAFNDTDRIDGLELSIELPTGSPSGHDLRLDDGLKKDFGRVPVVIPESLRTFPEERATGVVQITVPRTLDAGEHTIKVSATEEHGREVHSQELDIVVAPVTEVELSVKPQIARSRRGATYTLSIVNFGNHRVDVPVKVTDAEATLKMTLGGAPLSGDAVLVSVPPRQVQEIDLTVDAGMHWIGVSTSRMIEVDASFDDQTLLRLLTFVHRPLIPQGLASLLMVLLGLLLWALVMLSGLRDVVGDDPVAAVRPTVCPALAELPEGDEFGALSGSVAMSTSNALGGIPVTAAPAGSPFVPIACAATNRSGAFTFPELPTGTYVVSASAPGLLAAPLGSLEPAVDDDASAEGESITADEILALAGVAGEQPGDSPALDTSALDAALDAAAQAADPDSEPNGDQDPAAPVSAAGMAPLVVTETVEVVAGFETTGLTLAFPASLRELDLDGLPPGATVTLTPDNGAQPIEAIVGANGRLDLGAVPLGDYSVKIEAPGSLPAEIPLSVGPASDPVIPSIDLAPAPVIPRVSISGQLSTTHAPVGNATIRLTLQGDVAEFGTVEPAEFVTDETGVFVFTDMPSPATYAATITHPDLPTASSIVRVDEGRDAVGVALTIGTNTFGVLVSMPDVTATTVLTGTATNGSFTSMQQVKTLVPCAGPVGPVPPPCFEITGLPAIGVYTVTVTGEGFEPLLFDEVPYDPAVAFDTVTLTAKPLVAKRANITGVVSKPSEFTTVQGPAGLIAQATYAPAAGVAVELRSLDPDVAPLTAFADPAGNFVFAQVPGGLYQLVVGGQIFPLVQPGYPTVKNVQLLDPVVSLLTGTVTGSGVPIVGAVVRDVSGVNPPTTALMMGANSVAVAGLRPGAYLLTMQLANGESRQCRLTTTGVGTFTYDSAIHYPTTVSPCGVVAANITVRARTISRIDTVFQAGTDPTMLSSSPTGMFAGDPVPNLTVAVLLNNVVVWQGALTDGQVVVPVQPSTTDTYVIRLSGAYEKDITVSQPQGDQEVPTVYLSAKRRPKVEVEIMPISMASLQPPQLDANGVPVPQPPITPNQMLQRELLPLMLTPLQLELRSGDGTTIVVSADRTMMRHVFAQVPAGNYTLTAMYADQRIVLTQCPVKIDNTTNKLSLTFTQTGESPPAMGCVVS